MEFFFGAIVGALLVLIALLAISLTIEKDEGVVKVDTDIEYEYDSAGHLWQVKTVHK